MDIPNPSESETKHLDDKPSIPQQFENIENSAEKGKSESNLKNEEDLSQKASSKCEDEEKGSANNDDNQGRVSNNHL